MTFDGETMPICILKEDDRAAHLPWLRMVSGRDSGVAVAGEELYGAAWRTRPEAEAFRLAKGACAEYEVGLSLDVGENTVQARIRTLLSAKGDQYHAHAGHSATWQGLIPARSVVSIEKIDSMELL
jgi:hypothetical protein